MRHVTHVNEAMLHMIESCHTYEWIMSHATCHTYEGVMSYKHTATHCNTLQHSATLCNTQLFELIPE